MPLPPEERARIQREMFGMTEEEVASEKPPIYEPGLWAMSILSDVQEILARDGSAQAREQARQWINKAKYWIDVCRSQGERGRE